MEKLVFEWGIWLAPEKRMEKLDVVLGIEWALERCIAIASKR
jgi:hypothetical protein